MTLRQHEKKEEKKLKRKGGLRFSNQGREGSSHAEGGIDQQAKEDSSKLKNLEQELAAFRAKDSTSSATESSGKSDEKINALQQELSRLREENSQLKRANEESRRLLR